MAKASAIPQELLSLQEAAEGLEEVAQTGVTKHDGRWALMVWLRKGCRAPLTALTMRKGPFEVLYQLQPDRLSIARPAFPDEDKP